MISKEIFHEAPYLNTQFKIWFSNRNNRHYNIDHMPEFMALPIVVKWLDTRGLYIQRDLQSHRCLIFDYRIEEPAHAILVDCEYSESNEEWIMAAVKECISLLKSTS